MKREMVGNITQLLEVTQLMQFRCKVVDDCNQHGLFLSTELDLQLDLCAATFSNDADRLLLV